MNKAGSAARESFDKVRSSVKSTGDAIKQIELDTTEYIKENIRIQRAAIKELEQEVAAAEKRTNRLNSGSKQWAQERQFIAQKKQEIASEKDALRQLEAAQDGAAKSSASLRTQIMSLRNEMGAMRLAGKTNTEEYREAQDELKRLGTAYRQVSHEQKMFTTGATQWGGMASGIQGLTGALTAGLGMVSLFTNDTEKLAKAQKNLQAAMATVMGMAQLSNTLHATSAFRMATATKATNLYSLANGKLATMLGVSTAAAQVLMATLTLGLSAAIAGGAWLISKLSSESKKAKEQKKELAQAAESVSKSYANEGARIMTLVAILGNENATLATKIRAKSELNGIVKDSNALLDKEGKLIDISTEAIKKHVEQLQVKMRAKIYENRLEEQIAKKMQLEDRARTLKEQINTATPKTKNRDLGGWWDEIGEVSKDLREVDAEISKINNNLVATNALLADGREAEEGTLEYWQQKKKLAEDFLKSLSTEKNTAGEFEAARREVEKYDKEIKKFDVSQEKSLQKSADARIKTTQDLYEKMFDIATQTEALKVKTMKDGVAKRLAEIDGEHKAELRKLEKHRRDYLAKLSEYAGIEIAELPADVATLYEALKEALDDYYEKLRENESVLGRAKREYTSYLEEMDRITLKYAEDEGALRAERENYEKGSREYEIYTQKLINLTKRKNEEIDRLNREQYHNEYQSYTEHYGRTLSQINEDINKMMSERINLDPTDEQFTILGEKITSAIKQYQAEVAKMTTERPDLSVLFGDLSTASISALKNAIQAAKKELAENLDLSPEVRKVLKEGINNGIKQVAQTKPFQALREALEAMREEDASSETLQMYNEALVGMNNHLGMMLDTVGEISGAMGKDWSKQIDRAKTALGGFFTAMQKGGSGVQKVTGLISAIIAVAQMGADVINEKFNKSVEHANAEAGLLAQRLGEIANKKGLGDSLFTTDSFNKIQQLQKSTQAAFDAAQKSSDNFFNAYNKRLKNLETSNLIRAFVTGDALNLLTGGNFDVAGKILGINANDFRKNNKAAYEFFRGIRQYNMESLEDINRMLANIDAAYVKTKDKLGTAYLDQAKAAAESAKKNIEELRNAIKEMVGDIGNSIKDVILQGYRDSSYAIASITKEINSSLESILANRLFGEMFSEVFDTFSKDIEKAIGKGDDEWITQIYADLFDNIIVGQAEFLTQLDKAKKMAGQMGLNLFGPEERDSVKMMEAEIESLGKAYDRLKERASLVDAEQLEEDKKRIEELAEIIAKGLTVTAGPESNYANRDDFMAAMDEVDRELSKYHAAAQEHNELLASIADREATLLLGRNADRLLEEAELLERKKEAYKQTLPYIEEQIGLINDQLRGMSLEQLASDEAKALIARREELKAQQEAFQLAIAGPIQGSLAWLDSQISDIQGKLQSLSPDDLAGSVGQELVAQRKEYEAIRDELQKLIDGNLTIDADNAFGRIALIKQKLAAMDASGAFGVERDVLNRLLQEETKALEKELLKEYETIANKKLRLAEEYGNQIHWLREYGYEAEAKLAEERRNEELSSLDNAQIERTELYKNGIKQLADMSLEEVRVFIASMRKLVDESIYLTEEAKDAWGKTFREWEDSARNAADALRKEHWDGVKQGLDDVATGISAVSELLQTLGADGDMVIGVLSSITGTVQGVASIVGGIASGNWIGVFTGSLSALSNIYALIRSLVNDIDRQQAALTARAKELETAYTALQRAVQKSIGADTASLQKQSIENLAKQQAILLQQIAAESQRKKPDQQVIDAWREEIQKLQYEIEDIFEGMMSDLLQTDVKTFAKGLADAVFDAAANMKSSLQGVEDFTRKSIQDILRNYLQLQYLKAPVQALLNELNAELLANGPNREAFEKFQKEAIAVVDAFNESFEPFKEYFRELNIDNQLKSAITGASEQTVNAAVGLMNAIRIGQADSLLAIQYSNELLSQSVENQGAIMESIVAIAKDVAKIRENTDWIPKIYNRLNQNTLLNKGMTA